MYDEARRNLQNGVHPRLKAYVVWDNYTSSSHDDRVGLRREPRRDPVEQQHYNAFANDPLLTGAGVPEADRPDAADVVTRSAPEDGATVAGTVGVTGTATDDVGVESVTLLVDGERVDSATPGADGGGGARLEQLHRRQRRPHAAAARPRRGGQHGLSDEVTVIGRERRRGAADAAGPDCPRRGAAQPGDADLVGRRATTAAVTGYRVYRDDDRSDAGAGGSQPRRPRRREPRHAQPTPSPPSTPRERERAQLSRPSSRR